MSALFQLSNHLKRPISAADQLPAQRLFHGRGHAYENLDHVNIDWLPPVALITLYSPEPLSVIEKLADELLSLLPSCTSVQLQHRYQSSGPINIIRGQQIHQLTILEGNLLFHIRLGQTRNCGLFLDMSNGRQWVQQNSQGKRVLNLFAYTCGFSVAAVAGKAKSVLNVDMSRAALNLGRENHRLNQQPLTNVRFEKLNIFKSFSRLKKRGPYDLLICDPPTFQKGSVNIALDYPKILQRLDEFMSPNGTLLLCLNAPELKTDFLIEHMAVLAPHYHFVKKINTPAVYVDAEEKGLKVLLFKQFQH